MSITIKDVAKEAGVSKTTVSFYLNGKFQYMSDNTKGRIKKVIEELDYKPNSIAKGLKTKKSGLIGMIVADITNPFTSLLVKGVNDKCNEMGYQLIVSNTDNNPEYERECLELMKQRQVEGIVLNGTGANIDFIKSLKIKVIFADRIHHENHFDSVTTNNEKMIFDAVSIMKKKGFKEIIFLTYPVEINTTRARRYNGFKEAIQEDNKDIDASEYLYEINDQYEMKEKISYFNKKYKHDRKAIFAANGVVMLNAIQTILDLNLKIPEDIGICGFDDWGWNNLIGTGVSAISQPSYEVGSKSAEILIQRITGNLQSNSSINIELQSQLILRGSTEIE